MTSGATAKLFCLLSVCIGACAPVTEQPTGTRVINPASALVLPAPGGHRVVAVVERRYANALKQDVALATEAATPGQNLLQVSFLGLARAEGDDAIVPTAMTQDTIAAEMQSVLPGLPMSASAVYAQNAYGPFGFATGRGLGHDLCFYGWQRIEREVTTPLVRQGAIDIRLRLCQAGASERALLAQMYGYTVRVPFGGNWSAGEPEQVPNAGILGSGAPIYPVALLEAEASVERRATRAEPQRAPAEPVGSIYAVSVLPATAEPSVIATAPLVPGPGAMAVPMRVPMVPFDGGAARGANVVPIVPAPPVPIVLPDISAGVFP